MACVGCAETLAKGRSCYATNAGECEGSEACTVALRTELKSLSAMLPYTLAVRLQREQPQSISAACSTLLLRPVYAPQLPRLFGFSTGSALSASCLLNHVLPPKSYICCSSIVQCGCPSRYHPHAIWRVRFSPV